MQADDYPTDEALLRKIGPVLAQFLAAYQPPLPATTRPFLLKQILLTLLAIRRKATKQRLNWLAFAKRVAGEQVLIWLAQQGTPLQQANAQTQLMAQHQDAVGRYLRRHYQFHTTAVADEVVSDTFSAFFDRLTRQLSIESLVLTYLIGIARHKALHQLRHDRSGGRNATAWLETSFVTIEDVDTGSFEWPLYPGTEADDDQPYPLPAATPDALPDSVPMAQLRKWLADCFDKLPDKRRELIRQKHQYLTNSDLQTLSTEAIEALFTDQDMQDIAERVGYSSAHIASVRLNESHAALRDCIQRKRQLVAR
ncbi:RNA polymerase sigma factor [Fibrella sp. WM1]|uniref:RNA polymerase sigma factor n=1 Tax=Fibrella musci TaxID=3242485 RepID=UPI0035222169